MVNVLFLLLNVNKEVYITNCRHRGSIFQVQIRPQTDGKYLDPSRLEIASMVQPTYKLPIMRGNESPYCVGQNEIFDIYVWKHPNQ